MKCWRLMGVIVTMPSPPSRGAWIEMEKATYERRFEMLSPPSRGAWIEIRGLLANYAGALSPPSRGAWIEIRETY